MTDQAEHQHIQPPEPAHVGEQPSQRDLLRRVHEMEREIDALRSKDHRNDDVTISPLVLSPSSIPPNTTEAEIHKHTHASHKDDELVEQIRIRDQKIEYLEQNLALYQKRLKQTEELLYELQWDPAQDSAVSFLEDKSTLESRYETKISQLLEQMRIMERGLREKQQIIDELSGNHNTHFQLVDSSEIPRSAEDIDKYLSPSLKGLIISSGPSPRSSGMLHNNNTGNVNPNSPSMHNINLHNMPPGVSLERRGSQTIRRRNSTSQSTSSSSWLSYIPFWGNDKQSL